MKEIFNYYCFNRPEVAAYIPGSTKTILDIGCGRGNFLKLIKEQTGAETWGIELVPEIAEKAKGQVDNILTGKVEEQIDSIPNGYFDCITFNDVLEHLLEPTEVLKLLKPKLGTNGIIVASIPNVRFISNLYELLIKKDWEYKAAGILDSTHFRFFTQKSMKRMFETAGYQIIKIEGINEIKSWKFRLLNLLTFKILNDIQYSQFVCVAK